MSGPESVLSTHDVFLHGAAKPKHSEIVPNHRLSKNRLFQLPETCSVRRRVYGQDTAVVVDACPGVLGPDEQLFGVYDGHGDYGDLWSQFGGTLLTKYILASWWSMKKTLRSGAHPIHHRQAEVEQHLKKLFRRVEKDCMRVMKAIVGRIGMNCGGTTATVTLVMIARRRRWVIQAAVGDSPGYLATLSSGKVLEVTQGPTEANCDNKRSVVEYVARHQREGKWPTPICMSRWNVFGRQIQTGATAWGAPTYEPLDAWHFFTPETTPAKTADWSSPKGNVADAVIEVRPHLESHRILCQSGIYIGTQSLNFPETKQVQDEMGSHYELAFPERDAAANRGNSVGGCGQNTTGIGDISAGLGADCDASVHFYSEEQCRGELLVFGVSDGLGDVMPPMRWAENYLGLTQNKGCLESEEKSLHWLRTTTVAESPECYRSTYCWKSKSVYGYVDGGEGRHPAWDDVSGVGVVLPQWTGRRRRRGRGSRR